MAGLQVGSLGSCGAIRPRRSRDRGGGPVWLSGLDAVFPADEFVGPPEAFAVAYSVELGQHQSCEPGGETPNQSEQRRVEETGGVEHPVIANEPGRTRTPQVLPPPPVDLRVSEPPDQLNAVSLLLLEIEVIRHANILACWLTLR